MFLFFLNVRGLFLPFCKTIHKKLNCMIYLFDLGRFNFPKILTIYSKNVTLLKIFLFTTKLICTWVTEKRKSVLFHL